MTYRSTKKGSNLRVLGRMSVSQNAFSHIPFDGYFFLTENEGKETRTQENIWVSGVKPGFGEQLVSLATSFSCSNTRLTPNDF
jgi:hypothetical protein